MFGNLAFAFGLELRVFLRTLRLLLDKILVRDAPEQDVEAEGGAQLVRLLQPDAAANFLEHLLADIEAQADPIGIKLLAMVDLTVGLKQLLDVLLQNADSLIFDAEFQRQRLLLVKAVDFYLLVTLELIRICYQVQQYLLHAILVRAHLKRDILVQVDCDLVPSRLRLNLQNRKHFHNRILYIKELQLRREITILQQLPIQQVIHQKSNQTTSRLYTPQHIQLHRQLLLILLVDLPLTLHHHLTPRYYLLVVCFLRLLHFFLHDVEVHAFLDEGFADHGYCFYWGADVVAD